jgi:hypothetical protein
MMSPFDEAAARPVLDEPVKSSLPHYAFAPLAGSAIVKRESHHFLDEVDLETATGSVVTHSNTEPMKVDALDVPTDNHYHDSEFVSSECFADEKLQGNVHC